MRQAFAKETKRIRFTVEKARYSQCKNDCPSAFRIGVFSQPKYDASLRKWIYPISLLISSLLEYTAILPPPLHTHLAGISGLSTAEAFRNPEEGATANWIESRGGRDSKTFSKLPILLYRSVERYKNSR